MQTQLDLCRLKLSALVREVNCTLPNLSALVREAYNVTCLERSKQFGKKNVLYLD